MAKSDKKEVDPADLPYRKCVGVMLLNREGHVWVGRRIDMPGDAEGAGHWWQMPQGGIDKGEEAADAALRELYEETSVRSVSMLARTDDWLAYDLPDHLIGVAWKGRYRGQKQHWFVLRFEGDDSEIDIHEPAGGNHKPEFDAWKWVAVDELPGLIVPFKREVYVTLVEKFGRLGRPDAR